MKKGCQKLTAWKQKGSERITALDFRHKALRGESHGHFRHEIRPKVAESVGRHDGNQTIQVSTGVTAVIPIMKLFAAQMP